MRYHHTNHALVKLVDVHMLESVPSQWTGETTPRVITAWEKLGKGGRFVGIPGVINLACPATISHSTLGPHSGALRLPGGLQRIQVLREWHLGRTHEPLVHAQLLLRPLRSEPLRPQGGPHVIHFHRPRPPRIEIERENRGRSSWTAETVLLPSTVFQVSSKRIQAHEILTDTWEFHSNYEPPSRITLHVTRRGKKKLGKRIVFRRRRGAWRQVRPTLCHE